MKRILNQNLDYNRPLRIAEDIYWVGLNENAYGLQSNPYLVVDGGEAILIDGGSRPDFPAVMMKVMQTGVGPESISTLIYHHYDPDLCASIPNLESLIEKRDLHIISHRENNIFIRHYGIGSHRLACVETMGLKLTLKSGRVFRFFTTPYAHSAGSFMTLDEKTGVLFTSDIFGSYGRPDMWELFMEFPPQCQGCANEDQYANMHLCQTIDGYCPLPGLYNFARRIMTSNAALANALKKVREASPSMIAPQHGSIFPRKEDIDFAIERLSTLKDVGIDGISKE